ncbi:HNH endonuclease signature motif containing protein [Paraburkholderia sp. MM5384-R2]|uniref:HNH endonuclease signature motif containing protein n=1 Tax=Paraburkholderia sp. MM5384-R2 TaxID=2723097 RepID=UPI003905CED7
MANALSGRGKLIRLWLDQDRACIVCQQRITAVTGWHVHHIVRRVDGGSDAWSNLVMVHPDCHRQIHSRGLTVMNRLPNGGFERLEPCALKGACTVLRGPLRSNARRLPDKVISVHSVLAAYQGEFLDRPKSGKQTCRRPVS